MTLCANLRGVPPANEAGGFDLRTASFEARLAYLTKHDVRLRKLTEQLVRTPPGAEKHRIARLCEAQARRIIERALRGGRNMLTGRLSSIGGS